MTPPEVSLHTTLLIYETKAFTRIQTRIELDIERLRNIDSLRSFQTR
jgi:hypothetical protein